MTERICVYCKYYDWELNHSKAYCIKHECCINHKDTCNDWIDDSRTIKSRPYGFKNNLNAMEWITNVYR